MKAAVYYPYIHFGSRRWLRTAALYYDKITRIIPEGFEPDTVLGYSALGEDSAGLVDDIRALSEANVIDEERPEPHTARVAEQFFDVASTLLTDPKQRTQISPQLARSHFYRIHRDKLDPTLARILEEHGLAKKQGRDDPDWSLEPVIAGVYMMLLAQRMAGDRPLIADSLAYQHLLCASFISRSDAPSLVSRNVARLVSAVCRTIVPIELENVSIDKVLRVRESYAEHRERLQEKVCDLARSLDGVRSKYEVSDAVEKHVTAISEEVESVKDRLLSQNIALGSILLALAVPLGTFLSRGFSTALASGAIAVTAGVAKYLVERRIVQRSPWMYLVDVSNTLTPVKLSRQITLLDLEFDGDDDHDPFGRDWRHDTVA